MGNVNCRKMVDQSTFQATFSASRTIVLADAARENLFMKKVMKVHVCEHH